MRGRAATQSNLSCDPFRPCCPHRLKVLSRTKPGPASAKARSHGSAGIQSRPHSNSNPRVVGGVARSLRRTGYSSRPRLPTNPLALSLSGERGREALERKQETTHGLFRGPADVQPHPKGVEPIPSRRFPLPKQRGAAAAASSAGLRARSSGLGQPAKPPTHTHLRAPLEVPCLHVRWSTARISGSKRG